MPNENKNNSNTDTTRSILFLLSIFAIAFGLLVAFGEADTRVIYQSSTVKARQNYIRLEENTVIELYKPDRRFYNADTRGFNKDIGEDTGEGSDDYRPSGSKSTKLKIFFTSFNPSENQTDSNPCESATTDNICEKAKQGIQPLALSRDLIWREGKPKSAGYCEADCKFNYGDVLKLESDIPQCNMVGQLMDTMNKRYTLRGDIFYMDRKDNTSCEATITKLSLI